MEEIESMCSAFLWICSHNDHTKAKVAWKDVCIPKEEGRLEIRSIIEVNMVFSLKLIWRLFSETNSLWAAWVKEFLLRQESFWDVSDT